MRTTNQIESDEPKLSKGNNLKELLYLYYFLFAKIEHKNSWVRMMIMKYFYFKHFAFVHGFIKYETEYTKIYNNPLWIIESVLATNTNITPHWNWRKINFEFCNNTIGGNLLEIKLIGHFFNKLTYYLNLSQMHDILNKIILLREYILLYVIWHLLFRYGCRR